MGFYNKLFGLGLVGFVEGLFQRLGMDMPEEYDDRAATAPAGSPGAPAPATGPDGAFDRPREGPHGEEGSM